jgi:hypothetical protein
MLFNTNWDAMKAQPWRQVLLDAADFIDRTGWCQNRLCDDQGRVCAAEALMSVAYAAHDVETCAGAMARLSNFITSGKHSLAVVKWNDDNGRTAAEVTRAMRACARQ